MQSRGLIQSQRLPPAATTSVVPSWNLLFGKIAFLSAITAPRRQRIRVGYDAAGHIVGVRVAASQSFPERSADPCRFCPLWPLFNRAEDLTPMLLRPKSEPFCIDRRGRRSGCTY